MKMSKKLNLLRSSSSFFKIRSKVFPFFKNSKRTTSTFLKDVLSIQYLLKKKKNVFFKPFLNLISKKKNYRNLLQMLMTTRSFQKRNYQSCAFFYKFNNKSYRLIFSSKKKNKLLKVNQQLFRNTLKKLVFVVNYALKKKNRQFNLQPQLGLDKRQKRELQEKKKLRLQKYAILKINANFSNISLSLTSLTGQILVWKNGGSLSGETKRTRMTPRAVGNLMHLFLLALKKNKRLQQRKIRFLKIQFIGPSKKFRRKFIRMISYRSRRLKMSVLCWEEAYNRSFNGCRLHRRKR